MGTLQDTIAYDVTTLNPYGTYVQYLARRQYELSNHLGNVMATFSDVKTYTGGSYTAKVLSAQNYYPFGMQMPNKNYNLPSYSSLNKYRYGFNGQEREREVGESVTTAPYWEYDARTAHRWNVDPVLYPWNGGYTVFNCNPIFYADILGNNAPAILSPPAPPASAPAAPPSYGVPFIPAPGQADGEQIGYTPWGTIYFKPKPALTNTPIYMPPDPEKAKIEFIKNLEKQKEAKKKEAFNGPNSPVAKFEKDAKTNFNEWAKKNNLNTLVDEKQEDGNKDKTIGLGLDVDLARHAGTGAITYTNGKWQANGLSDVPWQLARNDINSANVSFIQAATRANAIRFDVTNYTPYDPRAKMTNFEFTSILRDPELYAKTTFVKNGKEVIWDASKKVFTPKK